MKAVIMAGGEGRRLKSITGERPKPMVPLLGRPMMEHILLLLKKHGFDEVCAAVKYRAEDIMRYFGDGSFIEKPLWPRVVTDFVNTGIYAVSPRVMELVPDGRAFDFGKELFPLLLRRGELIRGEVMDGYWCDVGTPLSYYQCCVDALRGRLDLSPAPEFAAAPAPDDGDDGSGGVICPCRDRAELMGTLSELFMDMGADYSDGLRVSGDGFELHIAPLASRSAVRVAIESEREEFARELTSTALELIRALDK